MPYKLIIFNNQQLNMDCLIACQRIIEKCNSLDFYVPATALVFKNRISPELQTTAKDYGVRYFLKSPPMV